MVSSTNAEIMFNSVRSRTVKNFSKPIVLRVSFEPFSRLYKDINIFRCTYMFLHLYWYYVGLSGLENPDRLKFHNMFVLHLLFSLNICRTCNFRIDLNVCLGVPFPTIKFQKFVLRLVSDRIQIQLVCLWRYRLVMSFFVWNSLIKFFQWLVCLSLSLLFFCTYSHSYFITSQWYHTIGFIGQKLFLMVF